MANETESVEEIKALREVAQKLRDEAAKLPSDPWDGTGSEGERGGGGQAGGVDDLQNS